LRNPPVSRPSEVDGGVVVPKVGSPGNEPPVFGGRLGLPAKDGCVPPEAAALPLPNRKLPRYQSKPNALESFWFTSTNRVLIVTSGGAIFSVSMACSIRSRSSDVARTVSVPLRSLKKTLFGGARFTPTELKKLITARLISAVVSKPVTYRMPRAAPAPPPPA